MQCATNRLPRLRIQDKGDLSMAKNNLSPYLMWRARSASEPDAAATNAHELLADDASHPS